VLAVLSCSAATEDDRFDVILVRLVSKEDTREVLAAEVVDEAVHEHELPPVASIYRLKPRATMATTQATAATHVKRRMARCTLASTTEGAAEDM
jgi:hypothetical protein